MGFFIPPPKPAHCVRTWVRSCHVKPEARCDHRPRYCSHTSLLLSKTANRTQRARSSTDSSVLHATCKLNRVNWGTDAGLMFWAVKNTQGAVPLPSLPFTNYYSKFSTWTLLMMYVHSRLVPSNRTFWDDGIFCICAVPYRAIRTGGSSVREIWPGWLRSSVFNIVYCKWVEITGGGYHADATPLSSSGSSDRLGSKITAESDCSNGIKRRLLLGRKATTKLDSMLKKKKTRHHFADKSPYSQSYGLSSSHAWMWELDHKEGFDHKEELMLSNCSAGEDFETDCKESKWVNPTGN